MRNEMMRRILVLATLSCAVTLTASFLGNLLYRRQRQIDFRRYAVYDPPSGCRTPKWLEEQKYLTAYIIQSIFITSYSKFIFKQYVYIFFTYKILK